MNLHFYEATAICFCLISIGLLWYIDRLRDARRALTSELSLSNAALDQVNARNQKLFLESMGPKPTPLPCPEPQDQFLELADLRLKLTNALVAAEDSEGMYQAERRSNAALRGQITKLTPKKKAKS